MDGHKTGKSVTLVLPWPPTVNHYKRIGTIRKSKAGKLYQSRHNSTETLVFYSKTAWIIRQEGVSGAFKGEIPLSVVIDMHPPDKRRADLDNRVKPILDALQRGGLFPDDYNVARLLITRQAIIPKGEIVVRVSEIEK